MSVAALLLALQFIPPAKLAEVLPAGPHPVMVIGHSAGAQAGFLMLTDPSAPIDALLSLDTTQDYAGLSDRSWAYFTDRAVAARADIRVPILFAAGPGALFELADSLAASPRTLMTVPEIGHNDYISQGVLRRHLAADSTRAAAREAATRGYRALAEYLGRWIDAVVAGASPPATATSGLVVSTVGLGVRGPSAEEPRTARHLRHMFATAPAAGFADAFLSMRRADPEVGSSQVLMMLAADAARRGDTARAKAALGAVRQRDSAAAAVDRIIEDRAKLFESIGAADLAREWFGLLRLLKGT